MKKSDKLSRKTRKMVAKNLIVLAVLATVAFVGVASWFTQNTTATANGLYMQCQIPDGLEVAITAPGTVPQDSDFKSGTIELNASTYSFLNTLSMSEITGDGITFIKPPISQESSVAKVNVNADANAWLASAIQTTANSEYVSFDLYMRMKTLGKKVAFDNSTYCGPLDATAGFGNAVSGWSPSTVVGAARVSVVNAANTARRLLWIPAPHLYYNGETLDTDVTSTSNTYGLFTKDVSGNTVQINSWGTYNHGYYKSDKTTGSISYSASASNVASNVTANTDKSYTLPYDVDLATFTSGNTATYNSKVYYQEKVRVNIWIEGEDTEARALQVGGGFKAIFNLSLKNAS